VVRTYKTLGRGYRVPFESLLRVQIKQATAQRCVLPVSFTGGFTTMAVINPPERKLAKRTSEDWVNFLLKTVTCQTLAKLENIV
jgi:hypothetical protein